MEPIYSSSGKTVGWVENDVIYDRSNRYRAFIDNDNVYTYQGLHLGTLDRGFFRDRKGHCIAFMRGASGGPIPPIPEISPVPPIPPIPPISPIPPIPSIAPIGSFSWSNVSWDAFLAG